MPPSTDILWMSHLESRICRPVHRADRLQTRARRDIGRPGIASELEAKILAAPKAPGRAEGVPQVADLWRYHRLPQQRADPGARLAAPVIELVLLNCRRWANADKEGGQAAKHAVAECWP